MNKCIRSFFKIFKLLYNDNFSGGDIVVILWCQAPQKDTSVDLSVWGGRYSI